MTQQRVLRRGDRGPDVAAWQTRLRELGHDPGPADGLFGPKTEKATKAFQVARGLTADGIVDLRTRSAASDDSSSQIWLPARNFTQANRGHAAIVVIHSTESARQRGAARAVAAWFAGVTAPRASAHYVVDDREVIHCVHEDDVAWAAPGGNRQGIQIELCGHAAQAPQDWERGGVLQRAAELVASICLRHDIPVRKLAPADLLAGCRGIAGHVDVSRAFKKSTHWDPGPGFPWDHFVALVARS